MAVAIAARGRLAAWFEGYRSALAQRDLRLLLGGLTVSTTGSWAFNVGLFAFVFNRTQSVGWVGAAGAVRFVSALVASPVGGVVAERVERVRLMVASDATCALLQAATAAAAALAGPVVLVLALAVLTTVANGVYSPAVAAAIPSMVDEDHLVAANALNGTIDNLVVIAGPAIGAALLVVGSPAAVFAVNAASFVFSALLVSRIRTRTPAPAAEERSIGILGEMAVALRTLGSLPAARVLVAFSALVSFVYGTDTVLFVAVSAHRLGTGSKGYGYLLAGLGVGGILMAAAVDRLARHSRLALIIVAGTLGYCLPTALLAVIHDPALAFVVQIVRGAATLVVDVLAITALQRAVPADQVARVFGIFFAVVLGAIALGAAVTPPVIGAIGLTPALMTMALLPGALGLAGLPALVSVDRGAAATTALLTPRVQMLARLDFFANASQPLLERLAAAAVEVKFEPGDAIVHEGAAADALYVLVEGEVQVTAHGELGSERLIRTMTAPSYFGEIGVLEQIPRTATVVAAGNCRCDRIEGRALLDALTTTPASSSLVENARTRLAMTHPSLGSS